MAPFGRQPSVLMHYDEGRCTCATLRYRCCKHMTVGISYKTGTEVSSGIYTTTSYPDTPSIDVYEFLIELKFTT